MNLKDIFSFYTIDSKYTFAQSMKLKEDFSFHTTISRLMFAQFLKMEQKGDAASVALRPASLD